jgi:hypothetical protein
MRDTPTDAAHPARHGRVIVLAGLIAVCLPLAGCGSSTPSHSRSATANPQALGFSKCMRASGVPSFPDAGGASTGNAISTPFGNFYLSANMMQSPAFKAAMTACARFLPTGARRAQRPSAQLIEQWRTVSVCMRGHGMNGFPDPTFVPPRPDQSGHYSLVLDISGVVLALPTTMNPQSPAFIQASKACNFQY